MQGCHVAFVCTDIPPSNTLDVSLPPVNLSKFYLMMTFFATLVGAAPSLYNGVQVNKHTCIFVCT